MRRENPAGSKLARAAVKARKGGGYGDGLRRLFTRNTLARMANKRRK